MSIEIKEPDENSTIEEHFQHYLIKSFNGRQLAMMSEAQRNEMRKCFFGGMGSYSVVADNPIVRKDLKNQLLTFWRKELNRYKSENN